MYKLIKLMAVALVFAFVIQKKDESLSDGHEFKQKEFFLTFFLAMVLGVFTGLRIWYNDTVTYLQMYEQAPVISEFWNSQDASFAGGYGFGLVNSLLKTWGASSQDFIMVYGVATMLLYITFLHRYSENFTLSVFLFFAAGNFVFAQAAIKQSLAMGICCWAVHCAIQRKWTKYLILVAVAALFHPYAVIFLFVPFMMFCPWTMKGYLTVIAFLAAGFTLDRFLGTIIDVTAMIGAKYDSSTFNGEGVNIFRVMVCFVPTILSFVYQEKICFGIERKNCLFLNLAMLNGLIMFVGLFGTANYFARLANYFLIMQAIALPWIFKKIGGKEGNLLAFICVLGYCGYFYYESAILRPFDILYSQTSLWNYLKGILS